MELLKIMLLVCWGFSIFWDMRTKHVPLLLALATLIFSVGLTIYQPGFPWLLLCIVMGILLIILFILNRLLNKKILGQADPFYILSMLMVIPINVWPYFFIISGLVSTTMTLYAKTAIPFIPVIALSGGIASLLTSLL